MALAAFALPLVASAQLEFNLEEVWVNGVQNGVANPIPGIDINIAGQPLSDRPACFIYLLVYISNFVT